jgi:hypothetical protein
VTFVRDTLRQARSADYPTVVGTVVESRIDTSSDGESTSHTAVVRYAYRVGDRHYESERYRYGTKSATRKNAERVTGTHPVGSPVTVHYRPEDPSDAVLQAGIAGNDLFMPLFLTPFNLIMFGGWAFACNWLRRRLGPRQAGGVRVVHRDTLLRVRLPEKPPLTIALLIMGALAFVSVFVIGFASGFEPDMKVIEATWAVLLAVSGVVYLHLALPVWAGQKDLLIDPFARRLTLPATFGRAEPVSFRFEDVAAVNVDEKVVKSDDSETRYHFPTVRYRDEHGDPQLAKLAKWTDRERANGFAGWLRERVGE